MTDDQWLRAMRKYASDDEEAVSSSMDRYERLT
jgi:hypothetical protein